MRDTEGRTEFRRGLFLPANEFGEERQAREMIYCEGRLVTGNEQT